MAVDRGEETYASHEAGTTREQLLVESCGVSRARTHFRNPAAVFLTANRNTSSSSSPPPQPELVGNTSRSSGTAMSNLCSIKNSPWRKGTSERGRNLLLATSLSTLLEVFPIDNFFHPVSRDRRGKMQKVRLFCISRFCISQDRSIRTINLASMVIRILYFLFRRSKGLKMPSFVTKFRGV